MSGVANVESVAPIGFMQSLKTIYLPLENVAQACLIEDVTIIGIRDLKEPYLHLKKEVVIKESLSSTEAPGVLSAPLSRLDDINGQQPAKRALAIMQRPQDNILLTDSPGAGKTTLSVQILRWLDSCHAAVVPHKFSRIRNDCQDPAYSNRSYYRGS